MFKRKGKGLHADATQDKAWAIDLYLVKHSGTGRAAVLVGIKGRLVGRAYRASFLFHSSTSSAECS